MTGREAATGQMEQGNLDLAERVFLEKGGGARKSASLEFRVATWRANKNQ